MQNLQIFNYNNTPVSFQMGNGDCLVNASQMAKPFRKRTNDWLSTKHAGELIASLSAKTGIPATGLVVVNQGGNNPGTWLHQSLALIFAQWLSPEFYLWCNDRIQELFRFGLTATDDMLMKAATDPGFVAIVIDELTKSRLKEIELEAKQEALTRQIEENAPKVAFYEQVQTVKEKFDKKRTYNISTIAHSLNMRPADLNRVLLRKGIAGKVNGHWFIPNKYKDAGIAIEREAFTKRYNEDTDREEMVPTTYLVWTAKGRELIFSLFEQQ